MSKLWGLFICFGLALFVNASGVAANQHQSSKAASDSAALALIEQALATYRQAQDATDSAERSSLFLQAARLFDAAASANPNPALYANAGTAYIQGQQRGFATLAFKRAIRLQPEYPQALRSLGQLRASLPAWVPRPSAQSADAMFAQLMLWTETERDNAMVGAFLLTSLLFALALGLRLSALGWAGGIGLLIFTALLAISVRAHLTPPLADAVITVNHSTVHTSDSINATPRFTEALPAGVEVRLVETRGRWMRVRFADQGEGWVSASAISMVARDG
jgi:tetratricopeptide (TPR) repeat protein